MKKSGSDYLIATAVLLCSGVLLTALALALSGWHPGGPGRILQVDFPDIAGIALHSDLRYAGAPAGRVIAIRPLTAEERAALPAHHRHLAIRVVAEIADHVGPIPGDVEASISSDTLLGEKYVALTAGSPDTPPLADGATLSGKPGFSLEAVASSLGPILESAGPLLKNADAAVTDLQKQLEAILPEMREVLRSADTAAQSATALAKRADRLLDDNDEPVTRRIAELGVLIERLTATATKAEGTLDAAQSLIGSLDGQVRSRMAELSVVLNNLKVATTHAKAAAEQIGEKPSRLIWGLGKPQPLTPEAEILRSGSVLPARPR